MAFVRPLETDKEGREDDEVVTSLRQRRGYEIAEINQSTQLPTILGAPGGRRSLQSTWVEMLQAIEAVIEAPGSTPIAWRAFQQQRLRLSVENSQLFVRGIGFALGISVSLRVYSDPAALLATGLFSMCFFVCASILSVLSFRVNKSVKGSREEWFLCIAHQSILITAALTFTTMSVLVPDQLWAHRIFMTRYFVSLACMVHSIYLPHPWHFMFVSFSGVSAWMLFHYIQSFLEPVVLFWGLGWPAIEMVGFHFAERREWSLFQVVEHERHARSLSESLKEAMRGMLNVVFDASCECDAQGRLVTSSHHLQSLLGVSCDEILGMHLPRLAANDVERQRIEDFFTQSKPQQGLEGAAQPVRPPALMETSLRRQGQQLESASSVLRVKLCCVALPRSCMVDQSRDPADDDSHIQRMLVGLQEVQTSEPQTSGGPSGPSDDTDSARQRRKQNVGERKSDAKEKHKAEAAEGDAEMTPNSSGGSDPNNSSSRHGKSGEEVMSPLPQKFKKADVQYEFARPPKDRSLTRASLAAAGNLHREDLGKVQDVDLQSLGSLSLTGTYITEHTAYRPRHGRVSQASVATQAGTGEFVPMQTQACQTTLVPSSASRRPPLPAGSAAANPGSSAAHPRKTAKGQVNVSKSPFLKKLQGTPKSSVEFAVQEHIVTKINPYSSGCCYWHAGLLYLSVVIEDMLSRKCLRKLKANSGWQCNHCKGLNECIDPDDADGFDQVAECSLCGLEIGLHEDKDADEEDQNKLCDSDSNFGDMSKSEGSEACLDSDRESLQG